MSKKFIDPYSGKMKSSRHANTQKQKRKLENIHTKCVHRSFLWPVAWSDYTYDWSTQKATPNENAYLKRYYRDRGSTWLKNRSHRLARRQEVYDSTYKKIFDYWWELY